MCRTGKGSVSLSVDIGCTCYSVGRYSNKVFDYRNIFSLTNPPSTILKIHTRLYFESTVFIPLHNVTYIRVQYYCLPTSQIASFDNLL